MNLYLPDADARELGWSLSLLLEWLHRADDQVLNALAEFGFGLRTEPRRHLTGLLDPLAAHAAVLNGQPVLPRSGGAA